MSQDFNQELDKISDRITEQELLEKEEDGSWKTWFYGKYAYPDKETLLKRKVIWKNLENDIQRRIQLIKDPILLNRFYNKLSKIEKNWLVLR